MGRFTPQRSDGNSSLCSSTHGLAPPRLLRAGKRLAQFRWAGAFEGLDGFDERLGGFDGKLPVDALDLLLMRMMSGELRGEQGGPACQP